MFDNAERRGATTVTLSAAQTALLQVVYDEFRTQTAWPTTYAVDRVFLKTVKRRRADLSAAAILRDLPEGLVMGGGPRPVPAPQDRITLSISAVARCAGAEPDVDAFLRAVRWGAAQEMKREPDLGETSVRVDRKQMQRAIPRAFRSDPAAMDRLFALLSVHHWGTTGSGRPSDGAPWHINLGHDVRRFRSVRSVEDFIDARLSWCEEDERHPRIPVPIEADDEQQPGLRVYLNPKILAQLRVVSGAAWDTTKVVGLAMELDTCTRTGCVFAAHALLRALLDHVPPLFGQKGFAGVASNHSWTQTDRKHMKKLESFRDQGDDALHRQISNRPDILMIDDLPAGAAVNALLQACIAQLQKP